MFIGQEAKVVEEDFNFTTKRFGNSSEFLGVEEIKPHRLYSTQYGNTYILSEVVDFPNPYTKEMSQCVFARVTKNGVSSYCVLDLVWVGVIPNKDGLWRDEAFCYRYMHDIFEDLL